MSVILDTTIPVSSSLYVTRFDINSRADLAAVDTTDLPLGTIFQFVTGTGANRIEATAELQAGLYNLNDVSQVQPNNYDAALNDKHWQIVGGFLAL